MNSLSFLQSRVYRLGAHAPSVLKHAQGPKILDAFDERSEGECEGEGEARESASERLWAGLANNVKVGAYIRFKVVRGTHQPDVDLSRPNQAEKDVFDRPNNSI